MEIQGNIEKAEEIAHYNCTHICLADCSAESYFSSENDCYKAAMKMAEWKDSQCLGTLMRVFDLIANKRDAGGALEYIKETLEFIIKDHYGDDDKDKTNKMIMKSYCNLMCIGNSENCISLAPCKEYSNIIHIFSEIDNKNK